MPDDQAQPAVPRPRRWHDQKAAAGAPAGSGRRRGLFRWLLALMALLGAFLAWLMFWGPTYPPAFLTFPITQYTDPRWPVNALAEQDSEHLFDLFKIPENQPLGEGLFHKPRRGVLFTSQVRERLVEELQKLRDHAEKDQAVVIHLNCLARPDAQGAVFLLPADARPEDPASWVTLADVLKWVEACPAKHKLLILDVMRPLADPRLGILTNDVADRVQELIEKKKPPYFVFCACSRGQVSLVWDDLGQSAFGHYLAEGLQGAADRYNPDKDEGVVFVTGLAEFVTRRVDRWAARLDRRQTPFLWKGGAKDFVLRTADRPHPAPDAKDYPARDYPNELRVGWARWSDWQSAQVPRTAPLTFREWEADLLQAEERWRGGLKAAGPELARALRSLEERGVAQARDPIQPAPRSLALLTAQKGVKADGAVVETLKKFLGEAGTGADTKAEDAVKAKVLQARQKEFKGKTAQDLALAVWEIASADDADPAPQRRARLLSEWYQALFPGATPYAETLFLQRLAGMKSGIAQEMVAVVRKAFRCVREGEALLGHPRALAWTRHLLRQAEAAREQGENSLFGATWSERDKAEALLEQAQKDFDTVRTITAAIEDAWSVRDRAFALLPGYPAYLMKRVAYDLGYEGEATWRDAVALTEDLDRALANPPGEKADATARLLEQVGPMKGASDKLNKKLDELAVPLAGDHLRKLAAPTVRNLYELDAVLELPWARAAERPDLTPEEQKKQRVDREAAWKQRQQLAQALLTPVRQEDAADDKAGRQTRAPEGFDAAAARRREQERAAVRARLAVELLKLGGFNGAAPLADDLDQAQKDPEADLNKVLGEKLFHAWFRDAPRQLADLKLDDPHQRAAADRLSRVLFPLPANWPWQPADGPDSPAARRRRGERAAYWQWLGDWYQEKSQRAEGPAREFYRGAAQEYRNFAREAREPPGQE